MAVPAQNPEDARSCQVGDRVRVRRQRWRVAAIDESPGCRTLTLDGLGPANLHEQQHLLEPFERIEPLASDARAARWVRGRRAWRWAWRDHIAVGGPWTALHAATAARLTVMPHQLEPVLAIIAGRASRVLLADAVGLGKTVQAGLILAELWRRGAITSALMLSPAGLRDQWRRELHDRFAIDATVCDLRALAQSAASLPLGVNPWALPTTAIASIDFIKRPEVLPAVRARVWDLVIVDEAHLVTAGSDRYVAVAQICDLALYVVLLTATPHNGDREAYAALCGLGRQDDRCLRFRRTRADVHLAEQRRTHHLRLRPSISDARMHAALDRYAAALRAEHGDDAHAALLLSILRKRALSSPTSLDRSVARRLVALGLGDDASSREQLWLPLDDGGGELAPDDDVPALEAPGLRDRNRERHLLVRLSHLAAAASERETKMLALGRLLRRLARRSEPVLVFTEYRDTLVHVQQTLVPDALVLHGGLAREVRNNVVEAFTRGPALVLLATDAAGEGLNLHQRCRCVVHLEVPWSPVRLEQRTGRVDRIGQPRTVHAFHLVLRHPSEEQLLQRLEHRAAVARHDLAGARFEEFAGSSPEATDDITGADGGDVGNNERAGGDNDEASCVAATAVEEATRIGRARLATDGQGRGHSRPPENRSERRFFHSRAGRAMRVQMRGRGLIVVERVVRDESGRPLAATVEAWWVRRRSELHERIRRRQPTLPPPGLLPGPAAAVREWCQGSIADRDRFWRLAHRRATVVAASARPRDARLFQPGLFDKRDDRWHRTRRDEQDALGTSTQLRAERLARHLAPCTLTEGRVWLMEP